MSDDEEIPTGSDLIIGVPFGFVYPPPKDPIKLPHMDARTAALRVLRDYIAELVFYRTGDTSTAEPNPFGVPKEQFLIEASDADHDLVFPSIVVPGGEEQFDVPGLNSYVDESTYNVFAPRTVLQVQYEHLEMLTLELWTTSRAERRSLLAGLIASLMPTEAMWGIRFRVPDYYDQVVTFSPDSASRLDEEFHVEAGRRIGKLRVEMRIPVVALVYAETLEPFVIVDVFDESVPLVGMERPPRT